MPTNPAVVPEQTEIPCFPLQTLEEVRQEIKQQYPNLTLEEFDAFALYL